MAFLKDEEKEIILEHYFDIEWCDDVSDLRCVHCHRVAIHPYVSNCQHILCKMCSKFYSDEDQPLDCPRCQEQITQLDNQDLDVEVKIHKLKIFCPNKKYGCKYAEQLRKIPSHLMVCVNTRKAAAALQVEATVTNTLMEVVNQLTSLNATIGELKEGVSEVKNKVNQLEKKSDDIDGKINALINEDKKNEGIRANMQLAFKNYTEEFKSIRSNLELVNERIEQSELLHQQTIALKKDATRATQGLMASHNETLQKKKPQKLNCLKAETYEWTIQDMQKRIRNNCTSESEVFRFTGCKYEIKARIDPNKDGFLRISLQFKDDDKINQFLNKDVFTSVTYIVRDQSDSPKKEDSHYKVYLRYQDGRGDFKWIFEDILMKENLSPPYIKDDCLKITILFEPPTFEPSFSTNGVLLWRVDNYKKRKAEFMLQDIWSPPFYTGPKGNRVRVQLSIWDSRSISVNVNFLTGEHDATLSPAFDHKIMVTLINQTDPFKNLVKSKHGMHPKCSILKLETRESMESSGFIKDDSLLLEVVLEPLSVYEYLTLY